MNDHSGQTNNIFDINDYIRNTRSIMLSNKKAYFFVCNKFSLIAINYLLTVIYHNRRTRKNFTHFGEQNLL